MKLLLQIISESLRTKRGNQLFGNFKERAATNKIPIQLSADYSVKKSLIQNSPVTKLLNLSNNNMGDNEEYLRKILKEMEERMNKNFKESLENNSNEVKKEIRTI